MRRFAQILLLALLFGACAYTPADMPAGVYAICDAADAALPAQAPRCQLTYGRASWINDAALGDRGHIAHIGSAEVARTEISFTLENQWARAFLYDPLWHMAVYEDGVWQPLTPLPEMLHVDRWLTFMIGYSLDAWSARTYHMCWNGIYGALEPGSYMIFRMGWLGPGRWREGRTPVYAVVEFEIDETTPQTLPPGTDK